MHQPGQSSAGNPLFRVPPRAELAASGRDMANGKADIYKVAYDERYKAYTPDALLTAMLMQHVIETDAVTKVDYLQGDDPYKKTWMGERQERWGIVAYNPRVGVCTAWDVSCLAAD